MSTPLPPSGHQPVLIQPTLDALALRPGGVVVDCTLGRGGHASLIAQQIGPTGLLIGLDVDPVNLQFAADRLKAIDTPHRLFHANFAELDEVLDQVGDRVGDGVDGILADLGLSTNQLFDTRYGLSFAGDGPLDMRIDPRIDKSAADWVNTLAEEDLANVLYQLAQERWSRRIARNIVETRRRSPIKTTSQLADVIRRSIPSKGRGPEKIDPATRSFLALRMKTNGEIENLQRLLERAPRRLKTGGRLAVISFQSTEDRIVKQALRSAEQTGLVSILTKRPISPTEEELAANPRSRSAKLRVVEINRQSAIGSAG